MGGRSRSSFTKRQKERSRQEKQREKAERRLQRKAEKPAGSLDDLMGAPQEFPELSDPQEPFDSNREDQ